MLPLAVCFLIGLLGGLLVNALSPHPYHARALDDAVLMIAASVGGGVIVMVLLTILSKTLTPGAYIAASLTSCVIVGLEMLSTRDASGGYDEP